MQTRISIRTPQCTQHTYLTRPLDQWRIRIHIQNCLWQRSVRPCLRRRGHDDRQVEQLADAGVGDHGIVVERGVEVAGEAVEAILEVEDEEKGLGLVQTFPGDDCAENAGLAVAYGQW